MIPSVLGVVALYLTGAFASPGGDCPGRLLGAWEYRQRAGEGYDLEGERIELSCVGESVRGLYWELFLHRPKSLQEVRQNRSDVAGFTKDTLRMQGQLDEGNLVLTCVSKTGSCPEAVMVFHKGK